MKKTLLLGSLFMMCGCAQSGKILGSLVTLPVKIVGAATRYDEDSGKGNPVELIDEAVPLNTKL